MHTADSIFTRELSNRGISYTRTPEGLYAVEAHNHTLTINLENVRRNYDRDGNATAIMEFVDTFTTDLFEDPSWEDVRPFLRYSLEPSDYKADFEEILFDSITKELCKVYVFVSPDGARITWIDKSRLENWGMNRNDVTKQAESNMREIVTQTLFEYEEIDGVKLGMLSTQETAFKASLILSSAFRGLVSPTHGWPVYVVAPCRDFVYVIATKDMDFLGRLGDVVMREYRNSGHPITKEVFEVSDGGIKPIGTFPEPD